MVFWNISIWRGKCISIIGSLFLEYEYISESETDLSGEYFDRKHGPTNIKRGENTSRRTGTTGKENDTSESIWSLDVKNGYGHQGICTNVSYPRNDNNETISLMPSSRRQSGKVRGATGDATSGHYTEGMYMGACKTNRRSEYEYDKGLMKSRTTNLTKTAETLSSDFGDIEQDFPQEQREYITESTHRRYGKKIPKLKKHSLHDTEHHFCYPVPVYQRKTEGQSNIHDNKIRVSSVVQDQRQYLGREEQILYPKHVQKPNAEIIPVKYIFSDRGADGQSKRKPYKKLNDDTMEPRDKKCQCKAHPGRARAIKYGTTWERQQETCSTPSPRTPPIHSYMEAFCQRTAEIMLEQLRRNPKSSENKMGNTFKTHRAVGVRGNKDMAVGGLNHPSEDDICGSYAFGDFGREELLSSEDMRNIGRDGISHESSRHHSQYSHFCETSLGDIPTLGQDTVKQDPEENDEYVEDELCEWGEPSEVSDIEENLDNEYCHQHVRVDEQSSGNPELSGQIDSYQQSEYSQKIKRD